jgi:hypothetical protein
MRPITLIIIAAVAGRAAGVQSLVRGAELAEEAAKSEQACELADARELLELARRGLRGGGPESEAAARGHMEARIEMSLRNIDARGKAIQSEKKAALQIRQGLLTSATRTWEEYDGKVCDPELGEQIVTEQARAARLIADADAIRDPKIRLERYREAARVNREAEGLREKTASAYRAVAMLPCKACRTAKKAVIALVVMGGTGAAVYYGREAYLRNQERQARQSSSQRPRR